MVSYFRDDVGGYDQLEILYTLASERHPDLSQQLLSTIISSLKLNRLGSLAKYVRLGEYKWLALF